MQIAGKKDNTETKENRERGTGRESDKIIEHWSWKNLHGHKNKKQTNDRLQDFKSKQKK